MPRKRKPRKPMEAVAATYSYDDDGAEPPAAAQSAATAEPMSVEEPEAANEAQERVINAAAKARVNTYVLDALAEQGIDASAAARLAVSMPALNAKSAAEERGGGGEDDERFMVTESDCEEHEYDDDDPRWVWGRPTVELQALCEWHGKPAKGTRAQLVSRLLRAMHEADQEDDAGDDDAFGD